MFFIMFFLRVGTRQHRGSQIASAHSYCAHWLLRRHKRLARGCMQQKKQEKKKKTGPSAQKQVYITRFFSRNSGGLVPMPDR